MACFAVQLAARATNNGWANTFARIGVPNLRRDATFLLKIFTHASAARLNPFLFTGRTKTFSNGTSTAIIRVFFEVFWASPAHTIAPTTSCIPELETIAFIPFMFASTFT